MSKVVSVASLFIIITINLPSSESSSDTDELIAVSVLYRHGSRSIQRSYSNDPYKDESCWTVPYGELNNVGKREHFALGKWLRLRYDSFLSSKYLAKEFHIQSSGYDRCLMSAAANLAGLYPPKAFQVWNEEIPWQPIPIHTIPVEMDGLLALHKPCPRYKNLRKELMEGEYFHGLLQKNEQLFAYLTQKTGDNITTIDHACYLYDTLFVENFLTYPLPEWTESVFPDKLKPLALATFEIETFTPEAVKFRAGQFFHKILEHFDAFTSNTTTMPKFKVYSGHDTNVFNILSALGIHKFGLVPYQSMVVFELKKSLTGRYYVNVFYKHDNNVELLEIDGNPTDFAYDKFKSVLKPLSMSSQEWDEACYS